ncbi:MAG TPA: glycosyltransferase [Ktedonobacterales bacterium]
MRARWLGWGLLFAERAWKHAEVVRFFRRPVPQAATSPELISILQPVLSGDPTMAASLERTLAMRTRYPFEVIWLADDHDSAAQVICRDLAARYPHRATRLVCVAPPGPRENPKLVKVIAGAALAHGDVLCILDDDTRLPDGGLEQLIPSLALPGVGLAFGLPYYESFSTLWSSLTSLFVNGNSLTTYLPYLRLSEPFTINGMLYALRRDVYDRIGGFQAIIGMAADDFAAGHLLRQHGYRLAQTPLRHGISTSVRTYADYARLMHRWLLFPRESVLRQLSPRERGIIIVLGLLPALIPLALLARLLLWPSRRAAALTAAYFAYDVAMLAHFNRAYLRRSTPVWALWLRPVAQALTGIQVIAALLAPQRMMWRGKVMRIERGGGFTYEAAAHDISERSPS